MSRLKPRPPADALQLFSAGMGLSPLTVRLGGYRLFGRLAFVFLLLCSILFGAAAGLVFVYGIDLPQMQELETYRPDVITELYADDGSPIATFALERRTLVSYEEIPKVLRDAILSTEDQHFEEHWGIDFPRVLKAAIVNLREGREAEGASTLTMQLARMLFLTPEKSFRRKIQETLLAIQIERHYTKPQIFTMYCNQVYLGHGNYGFEAASEFYFGKHIGQLTLPEAALLAGLIRGPSYSPILHPARSLARRDLVLDLMDENHKISRRQEEQAKLEPLGLRLEYPSDALAPYFVEEVRQWPRAAVRAGGCLHGGAARLHDARPCSVPPYRRCTTGCLLTSDATVGTISPANVLRDHFGTLASYDADDRDRPMRKDRLRDRAGDLSGT